jgi:hypothetical protein
MHRLKNENITQLFDSNGLCFYLFMILSKINENLTDEERGVIYEFFKPTKEQTWTYTLSPQSSKKVSRAH